MLAFAIGRVIEKTRHHVRHAAISTKSMSSAALSPALSSPNSKRRKTYPAAMLPSWLGREVTGEERFYNASLALGDASEIAA